MTYIDQVVDALYCTVDNQPSVEEYEDIGDFVLVNREILEDLLDAYLDSQYELLLWEKSAATWVTKIEDIQNKIDFNLGRVLSSEGRPDGFGGKL